MATTCTVLLGGPGSAPACFGHSPRPAFEEAGVTLTALCGHPNVVEELKARGVEVGFPIEEDLDLAKAREIQDLGLELFMLHNDDFDHEMVQPAVAVTNDDGDLLFGWSWKDLPSHDVKTRPTPMAVLDAIAKSAEGVAAEVEVGTYWHKKPE
eukprot:scaffold301_cov243-Pinguiococcus_pyrenoidosus.AAC.174